MTILYPFMIQKCADRQQRQVTAATPSTIASSPPDVSVAKTQNSLRCSEMTIGSFSAGRS